MQFDMRNHHSIAILLGFVFCFCQCSNQPSTSSLAIAALRGPSSVAMIQLIDSLESQDDATIKVEMFNEPLQVRKMMLDGTADFAVLPTTMAALLFNKDLDYRLCAVPLWGTLYLCGTDTSISEWKDLRDKTVYLMAKGMTPDVLFQHLLIENGLSPYQDVNLDYRFPTHIDLANATMAGQANLSVISEPYLSQALLANPDLHILMDLEAEWQKIHGTPAPETALVVKGSLADKHDSSIQQLVNAYQKSANWVLSHPEEAAHLAVQHGIIADSTAVVHSIPRSHIDVKENQKAETEAYLRVFYDMQAKIIGDKMPDERFYYE